MDATRRTVDPRLARRLRRRLLAWYARAKRPLPWRATRDPYRIWISESMLQQTRVETVIAYYERFLARFPTVEALARAHVDDVLAAWSGLGYYRRARQLHAAARAVVERHSGRFPFDRASLLALPGIGPYTAGAVASIAFDRAEPLVDGNVARVLSRLFALDGKPSSARSREALWSIASDLLPARGAGEWNQSLMELGALVCAPREPRCGDCPLARECRARIEDRVGELPRAEPRRTPIQVDLVVLAIADGERLLLERRPARGRMAGMWQLPTLERPRRGRPVLLFPARWPSSRGSPMIRGLRAGAPVCAIRHTITHHRIRAEVRRGTLLAARPAAPLRWFPGREVDGLALTGMTRKCLSAILAAQARSSPSRSRPRKTSSPARPSA